MSEPIEIEITGTGLTKEQAAAMHIYVTFEDTGEELYFDSPQQLAAYLGGLYLEPR